MIAFLFASVFFTTPAPLDMPRAEGWVVRDHGVTRFEDRYDSFDLWSARTVTGYWLEDGGSRGFLLAELEYLPPAVPGSVTRLAYEQSLVRSDRRDDGQLLRQLQAISPVAVTEAFVRPRQLPRGMRSVRYYEGTNSHHIVCVFLPEKSDHWSVAVWELAKEDDREELRRVLENDFWAELKERRESDGRSCASPRRLAERELLRRDAAHSVAAYEEWRCSPGEDFVILDDLGLSGGFIASLTNDLAVWRGKFAAALPAVLDTTNTLSVARIYRNRTDFLAATAADMQWAAAYWNPQRRELVACLPPDGDLVRLRRTFRHEAFHQYLSYATGFVAVSPWLNEGYAQYFEDEGRETFDLDFNEEQWDEVELALPALLRLDYPGFYAGTDVQRRTNYRLAWSVVYFIEHGLDRIRHEPFRTLKRDYLEALSRTGDMRQATQLAFGTEERLRLFCNAWKQYWKNRH